MEGEPRFPTSQEVPWFPYAEYACLLGLDGFRIERAEQIDEAWQRALAAQRPVLIEAVVDPDSPLLPPRTPAQNMQTMLSALEQEGAEDTAAALRRHREQEAHDERG